MQTHALTTVQVSYGVGRLLVQNGPARPHVDTLVVPALIESILCTTFAVTDN